MVPRDPGMSDLERRRTEPQEDTGGDVQSPERPDTATRRTSASSTGVRSESARENVEASQSSITAGDSQRNRPRPQRLDYGSIRSESTQQSVLQTARTLSPDRLQAPRRPVMSRRSPSSNHPHRGERFSVEDDPDEVDEDKRLERTAERLERTASREVGHRDRTWDRDRERQLRRQESSVRRRPVAQPPPLPTVPSEDREEQAQTTGTDVIAAAGAAEHAENGDPSSEETLQGEEEEEEEETPSPDTDDADTSDAESFTLKDRQEAINETHPFGIRIWKPALYKKSRSVQRNAEGDIHSAPGGNVSWTLYLVNVLWTLVFGWWLSIVAASGGFLCMLLSILQLPGCFEYGRVLINLSHYLFYPFGKYVKLEREERYWDEDEGEGRSITDYERWQTGDLEEGRLFFGPTDLNRSLIGRRRDEVEDANETDSLLGRQRRHSNQEERTKTKIKKRFFGRGTWNIGRVIFFLSFYFVITPCLFFVSALCWFFVFTIPMGKVTLLLFYHLRRHPLAMSFHTDSHYSRGSSFEQGPKRSSILLCTYRAVGLRYWKYTVDGTNIFLINLLALVGFTIFQYFILYETLGIEIWLTNLGFVFICALASIIPLAYFIGQAVASISAQSSMGVGATINAFFATIVEVFLYCVALKEGKSQLVEGSIIGSIFAGILFLPGLSMVAGAIRRKTQRFNSKSASVTSTMLLFAVIGVFGPTLFYQMYGSHEMKCHQCLEMPGSSPEDGGGIRGPDRDCRRCYFSQTPAIRSNFYLSAVRPYIWLATICLFLSYGVGLVFTLRTHAAVIWNNEPDEKKEVKMEQAAQRVEDRHNSLERQATMDRRASVGVQGDESRPQMQRQGTVTMSSKDNIKDSQMYKRILNQSLRQVGASTNTSTSTKKQDDSTPHVVPPKTPEAESNILPPAIKQRIQGLSTEDNRALVQEIAEIAATAATVAARDATRMPRRTTSMLNTPTTSIRRQDTSISSKHDPSMSSKDTKDARDGKDTQKQNASGPDTASLGLGFEAELDQQPQPGEQGQEQESGGHDAPNWSRQKSATILLTATIAYAVIAEILVDTVDSVLQGSAIDEKFLGITLFALVPNTTEFLNAIAFAMNGNVALSMEIGSSYALQVILLQIPCLVLFSEIYTQYFLPSTPDSELLKHSFTLIFPQWDMVTTILGVFLMGWVVGEGKSNYFKGSTLILTYFVIMCGFWFSGYINIDNMGVDPYDTLALGGSPTFQQSSRTVGKGTSGFAYR